MIRQKMNNRAGRKKQLHSADAFTLVEMLIVIAIIGILAAILVPSLRTALNTATLISCMNNLRAMGQGVTMYAGDSNDYLPRKYKRWSWSFHIANEIGLSNRDITASASDIATDTDIKFAPVSAQFVCPAQEYDYGVTQTQATGSRLVKTSTYIPTVGDSLLTSGITGGGANLTSHSAGQGDTVPIPEKKLNFVTPSSILMTEAYYVGVYGGAFSALVTESRNCTRFFMTSTDPSLFINFPRHQDRTNVLLKEGSVITLRKMEEYSIDSNFRFAR